VSRSVLARQLLTTAWLAGVWALLWSSVRPDVLLGGVLVGAAALTVSRLPALPRHSRVRWHLLPLLGLRLVRDLAMSAVEVTTATLRRGRGTRSSIIAVEVPPDASDAALTTTCQRISVEPGSLVIDLDRERDLIFVYQLDTRHESDVERAREQAAAVVAHVMAVFPPREPRAAASGPGTSEEDR
jgi:multicomponent Na+:H+ antiporter subunit E